MARNGPDVQDAASAQDRTTLNACGRCREPLASGSRFCTKCGWNASNGDRGDPVIVIDDAGGAEVVKRSALPPLPERAAPLAVSTKAPADPRQVKRRSVLIIAVSIVACLLSVALLVFLRDPGAPAIDVNVPLEEGATTLVAAVGQFRGPALLADYDAAAQEADEASDTYAERLEATEGVEDEEVRQAALRLLRAERRTVRQFATVLAGLEGADLEGWTDRSLQVSEAIDSLAAAEEALLALGDEDITVDGKANVARQILAAVDRRMERKLEQYEEWQVRLEAETARRDAENRTHSAYVSVVQPLIAQYSESRENLQEWTSNLDTSATPAEVYTTLDLHSGARVAIYNGLVAVTPTSAFQSVHGELVNIVDQAVDVVGAATAAVDSFLLAPVFQYRNVQETPGWQYFVEESDRISAAYASVLSRWEQTMTGEQARIDGIPLPPEPQL